MRYEAKDMPAWVRFRERAAEKPAYTVPTHEQWLVDEMLRNTLQTFLSKRVESVIGNIDRRSSPFSRNN